MKKIFALMLVGTLGLTGCLGTDEDDEDAAEQTTESGIKAEFGSVSTDTVFNIIGPKPGAFDLVAGEQKSSSDGDGKKDLIDNGLLADGSGKTEFSASFTSGNESFFAELDLAEGASNADILAAVETTMEGSGPSMETEELVAGDILAVFSGQTFSEENNDFYLVKIIEVVANDDENAVEDTNNGGYIVFEYSLVDIDESTLPDDE